MSKSTVLLEHHLKALKLPTMLREYAKTATRCARENVDHTGYLLQLTEQELIERERRAAERRLKAAKFPTVKTLESFDFTAQPSINKTLVVELMRCVYLDHRENILIVGSPGTGKTHLATALGVEACHRGKKVRFCRVTELITQLMEARDAGIVELRPQIRGQPQAMIRLPQEHQPGVGTDPRVGLPDLDRTIKRSLEEPSLAFTHAVYLLCRATGSCSPTYYAAKPVMFGPGRRRG